MALNLYLFKVDELCSQADLHKIRIQHHTFYISYIVCARVYCFLYDLILQTVSILSLTNTLSLPSLLPRFHAFRCAHGFKTPTF